MPILEPFSDMEAVPMVGEVWMAAKTSGAVNV